MRENQSSFDRFIKGGFLNRLILYVLTVGVIVAVLPRDVTFNYYYDEGSPWHYGQLMATYDFPIYKSASLVEKEQDSIRAAFQPYLNLDESVSRDNLQKLRSALAGQLRPLIPSSDYSRHILETFEDIYALGIVSTEDMERLTEDSVTGVMVVRDRTASSRGISYILSEKEAYTALLEEDTVAYNKDVLRRLNLDEFLSPNLILDEQRTQNAWDNLFSDYSLARGMVQSGQKIIDRGEIVSSETYEILESLKKESASRSENTQEKRLMLLGQILLVGIAVGVLMIYLMVHRKSYFKDKRSLILLLSFMAAYTIFTSMMVRYSFLVVYYLPYVMFPLTIKTFLDTRTSFLSFLLTVIICSTCLNYPHEFIILQVMASLVAIYGIGDLTERGQIFRTTLYVLLTYLLVFLAYELITENSFQKMNRSMFGYLTVSSLLALFTYPLLWVLEKVFGFTSNVTLSELSNTEKPLLKQLSNDASGTFQHSYAVANLASMAAQKVGANALLVRAGALYHDIGKLADPAYFTENQANGANPLEGLSCEESAQIILSHVKEGLNLAAQYHLPRVIREFISTHHGKGVAKYFYRTWKNDHEGMEPPEGLFDYPGPNPQTLEQAILMMADSVEASSRSLKSYDEESISSLVDRIIDEQFQDGFFNLCPITLRQISIVKEAFKEKLRSTYHTRIAYPVLKKEEVKTEELSEGEDQED